MGLAVEIYITLDLASSCTAIIDGGAPVVHSLSAGEETDLTNLVADLIVLDDTNFGWLFASDKPSTSIVLNITHPDVSVNAIHDKGLNLDPDSEAYPNANALFTSILDTLIP